MEMDKVKVYKEFLASLSSMNPTLIEAAMTGFSAVFESLDGYDAKKGDFSRYTYGNDQREAMPSSLGNNRIPNITADNIEEILNGGELDGGFRHDQSTQNIIDRMIVTRGLLPRVIEYVKTDYSGLAALGPELAKKVCDIAEDEIFDQLTDRVANFEPLSAGDGEVTGDEDDAYRHQYLVTTIKNDKTLSDSIKSRYFSYLKDEFSDSKRQSDEFMDPHSPVMRSGWKNDSDDPQWSYNVPLNVLEEY
jgi:hypothetical protein